MIELPERPIIKFIFNQRIVDFVPYLIRRGCIIQEDRFNLVRDGIIPLALYISHLDDKLTAVEAYVNRNDSAITLDCRQRLLYGHSFVELLHEIGRDYPETGLIEALLQVAT